MQQFLARITEGLPQDGQGMIKRVSEFSRSTLDALNRRSGESYAVHSHEVAAVLREVTEDAALLSVALLHDVPVHPEGESVLQCAPITEEQRNLVLEMHKLRRLHIDELTQDLDKALQAFAGDSRLLPLRMAHRVNDVRHLQRFDKTLQKALGRETLHMYSAIAGRLSMHRWRHEMEDACFLLLQPEAADSLKAEFQHHQSADERCLKHVKDLLSKAFQLQEIDAEISSRTKSLYSTYRKMVVKRRKFEELTDRLALRILVPKMEDCYRALGIVHTTLHPMPGKLKDYIGAPKENGYQSIHTVIFPLPGVTEFPIEIQIRTPEMHEHNELGSARHSDYKHSLYPFHSRLARVDLFRNLLTLRDSARSPEQFERALRTYFNEKQIAIFDEKNTLFHLPSPVTALDFACRTSEKRIRSLKSVKVNGHAAPLDVQLKNGDTVECIFTRTQTLREDWVQACKQASSRKLIREIASDSGARTRKSAAARAASPRVP